MENSKMMLERQNKELKVKLEEVENSNRAKAEAAIAALESKVTNLEEQLSAEAQERMLAAKGNRKLEKKTNGRMKAMRRQLDEAEEEISREKAHRRKAQRELDDCVESNESMNREINNLKNKLRRGMTGLPSSRLLKGRGSVVPGDDTIADTESVDGGGEESEK